MNNISNKTKETLINSLRNSDLKIIKKKFNNFNFYNHYYLFYNCLTKLKIKKIKYPVKTQG